MGRGDRGHTCRRRNHHTEPSPLADAQRAARRSTNTPPRKEQKPGIGEEKDFAAEIMAKLIAANWLAIVGSHLSLWI